MAALGSQSIASSYEQLLHVDADGGGNSTTHVSVKDGDNGTTFGFTIASDALMMSSTNRLEFGDTGTYIHQSADGVLDLVSDTEIELNGTIDINGAVTMDGGNVTINDDSGDYDFRVESNGNANMLFVDAGNDLVGIGTASPHSVGHIEGDLTVGSVTSNRAAQVKSVYFAFGNAGSSVIAVSGTFCGLLMVTTEMHSGGSYATAGYSVTSIDSVAAVSSEIWYNNSGWTSAIANGTNTVTITIDASSGGSGSGNVVFIGTDNDNSIAFSVS